MYGFFVDFEMFNINFELDFRNFIYHSYKEVYRLFNNFWGVGFKKKKKHEML